MWSDVDTIAAIATPKGMGALGIIRISGPSSVEIVKKCFDSKNADFKKSHQCFYGLWKNPTTGDVLDEVVVLNFEKGFTGETSCEVIGHGGPFVVQSILDSMIQAGARMARPGEFTYRAVMNGKLDLAQAEAINDLISARSSKAAQVALLNIQGGLSRRLSKLEGWLVKMLAHLEASIDFTTEDIQPFDYPELSIQCKAALDETLSILDTHVSTQVVNHGLRVAIVGKPNAGKSSLLNLLLGRQRSIVTDTPGTTRDTVEASFLVNQNLITLIDTAGLRATTDNIETLGQEKSWHEIKTADLILYIVDSSVGVSNEDTERWKALGSDRLVICFNKSDLKKTEFEDVRKNFGLEDFKMISSSALESHGASEVLDLLRFWSEKATSFEGEGTLSTARQKEGMLLCHGALERAKNLLEEKASQEFIALEVKQALTSIQDVLGKNPKDEVLDQVFKDFCIGK